MLITTRISYLDIFRDIIDKHKKQCKNKEFKFSSTEKEVVKNLLYDLVTCSNEVSIHVKKGTTKKPFYLLTKILNNIKKMHYEVILVLDKNFLTNNKERITLENEGFTVVIKESNIVPGIKVADLVAGCMWYNNRRKK